MQHDHLTLPQHYNSSGSNTLPTLQQLTAKENIDRIAPKSPRAFIQYSSYRSKSSTIAQHWRAEEYARSIALQGPRVPV